MDLSAARRVVVGVPLSLSGRYGFMGRLAAAGLEQAIDDSRTAGGVMVAGQRRWPELVILDDMSQRRRVRPCLDALARADLLVGPYGSDLMDEAAAWAAEQGRTVWNHGGSADDVQRRMGVVSILSPASRYLAVVLEALAEVLPGASVLVAVGAGRVGRAAADGAREAAARLGMELVGVLGPREVPDAPDVDVVLTACSFPQDLELLGRLRPRPRAVAAVAGGLGRLGAELGRRADMLLAPSQWEEGVRFPVDVGPGPAAAVRALRSRAVGALRAELVGAHVDYPAAQAYATGLLALHCLESAGTLTDAALEAAARRLRCFSFFGGYRLGEDGRQAGHDMVVIQWYEGVKRVVWPLSLAEAALVL